MYVKKILNSDNRIDNKIMKIILSYYWKILRIDEDKNTYKIYEVDYVNDTHKEVIYVGGII